MLSTPPAIPNAASPQRIACARLPTAFSPDPHRRLTVAPGTPSGRPASSTAMRATSTSSTAPQSTDGLRSISARNGIAARSSARTLASAPFNLPIGVRIASQMKASGIGRPLQRLPKGVAPNGVCRQAATGRRASLCLGAPLDQQAVQPLRDMPAPAEQDRADQDRAGIAQLRHQRPRHWATRRLRLDHGDDDIDRLRQLDPLITHCHRRRGDDDIIEPLAQLGEQAHVAPLQRTGRGADDRRHHVFERFEFQARGGLRHRRIAGEADEQHARAGATRHRAAQAQCGGLQAHPRTRRDQQHRPPAALMVRVDRRDQPAVIARHALTLLGDRGGEHGQAQRPLDLHRGQEGFAQAAGDEHRRTRDQDAGEDAAGDQQQRRIAARAPVRPATTAT
ncbi:hypothetical protein WR25_25556 [Diploscapter pachys]|uniref:Uncharacterized protein n=1 Tax=Diploscapter pachys TaxID=2018661 RepID=A0A2A2M321_9BILA|nr:hypothetical protein WR25_25556 [Diploscapter pachys]